MEAKERPAKIPRLDPGQEVDPPIQHTDGVEPTTTEPGATQHTHTTGASTSPSTPRSDASPTSNSEPQRPPLEQSGTHSSVVAHHNPSDPSLPPPSTAVNNPPSSLSKSALKKFRKKQQWEAGREARKLMRKERKAQRRERDRKRRQEAAQARGGANGETSTVPEIPSARKKRRNGSSAIPLPLVFMLDCGFDELMTDKEVVSLASQITRCYSETAMAGARAAKLVIAGCNGRLRERFDTVLQGHYRKWKGVEVTEKPLQEALKSITFSKKSVEKGRGEDIWKETELDVPDDSAIDSGNVPAKETIYLTADSPHTLETLSPYTTYIVGALVDRNRHKNICLKRAEEMGIKTAKLPIAEHLAMRARKVLATNHVIEIMLGWLENQDWGTALQRGVPARTGAVLRTQNGAEREEEIGGKSSEKVERQNEDNEGQDGSESEGCEAETEEISADQPDAAAEDMTAM